MLNFCRFLNEAGNIAWIHLLDSMRIVIIADIMIEIEWIDTVPTTLPSLPSSAISSSNVQM